MKLTEDQKARILQLSREAQHFQNSDLFHEFEKWIISEKERAVTTLVTNIRETNEESMSRAEFVERRSAYYMSLDVYKSFFKQIAAQESALNSIEENERSKSNGTGTKVSA